ncbi:MAG: pyridoxamine kinase [Bacilli bacterium]|nr:pyridoxamine kinase [Bacilli bacterium]
MMKKILTIQDISCVGQCSLTVALPIISAMGIETAIIPSAVLSTHTGGFSGYTFRDLTEDLPLISNHWQKEKITFDGIYTGYIGSTKQIEYIKDIIDAFKQNNLVVVVDPAMADHGKLYYGFDDEFVGKMRTLIEKADYIVPNITEACFLTNTPYFEKYTKEDIEKLLIKLSELGPNHVVLTGISFDENKLGVAMYDKTTNEFKYYFNERVPLLFHGTGDIFASSFFGAIINGLDMYEASKVAVDFTLEAIKHTIDDANEHWYGVHFEKALPYLLEKFK